MARQGSWSRRIWEDLSGTVNPSTGSINTTDTFSYTEGTGTLSAVGQKVTLNSEGTASAVVSIKGTFVGEITAYGAAADGVSSQGGRIAFLSGVGSLGSNVVVNNGSDWDREFRFVTGGHSITLEATGWTSGTAEIELSVSPAASLVFVNGPVHNADEEAVRDGRGFVSNTGVVPVTNGNVLILTLQNPADSGVNLFITDRTFANNQGAADENLEFVGYANPTYVPTTLGAGVNRKAGGPTSVGEFRYQVRSLTGLSVGGIMGVNTILPNGVPYDLEFLFVIPPSKGLGIVLAGAGQNIGNAVRTSIGLEWYEEDSVI